MLRTPLAAVPSFLACNACRRATVDLARPALLAAQVTAVAGPSRQFSASAVALGRRNRQERTILRKRREKRAAKKALAERPIIQARRAESAKHRADLQRELQLELLAKQEAAEALTRDLPEYTEEDYERVYEALLASAGEAIEKAEKSIPPPKEEPVGLKGFEVVRKLYQRLLEASGPQGSNALPTSIAPDSRLDLFMEHFPLVGTVPMSAEEEAAILRKGEQAVRRELRKSYPVALQRIRTLVAESHGSKDGTIPKDAVPPPIRLPVATKEEWSVLLAAAVWYGDKESVKEIFHLMRFSGYPITDSLRHEVLDSFARQGRIHETQDLTAYINKTLPEEAKIPQDYLIKAFAHAGQLAESITQLHQLEALNTPASLDTYTHVISGLLRRKGIGATRDRALAWDLFAHMRYVAHPTPSAHLYSEMIRACAMDVPTQPERAQDLFIEMTVDAGHAPTTEAYNALILVLARKKRTAHEAFRLLQEMIQRYRDEPSCGLRPDRGTYTAILESAKRLGDLARARWILAELLRDAERGGVLPDEELMSSVFQTYAAYRVPYVRGAVKVVDQQSQPSPPTLEEVKTDADGGEQAGKDARVPVQVQKHAFTPIVPQSHGEVLREVEALMARILEERKRASERLPKAERDQLLFRDVVPSTRLWNSFQSVFWAHASLDNAMAEYHRQLSNKSYLPNARTYLYALERCAYPKKEERSKALDFARRVWMDWLAWLGQNNKGLLSRNVPAELGILASDEDRSRPGSAAARVAERCWSAMVRITALNDMLDESLSLVRVFMRRFPPQAVKVPAPPVKEALVFKPLLKAPQADRTQLEADDAVPPVLLFRDVELLHHRLVMRSRWEDVGYVKWACKAYEGGVMVRKEKRKEIESRTLQQRQQQQAVEAPEEAEVGYAKEGEEGEQEEWESDSEAAWEEWEAGEREMERQRGLMQGQSQGQGEGRGRGREETMNIPDHLLGRMPGAPGAAGGSGSRAGGPFQLPPHLVQRGPTRPMRAHG